MECLLFMYLCGCCLQMKNICMAQYEMRWGCSIAFSSQWAFLSSGYCVDEYSFTPTLSPSWALTWQFTSKTTFPHRFPSSLLPGLWGRLAAVRPRVAYSRASDVLAFCPLSVTAADCQWLPGWQSFTQLRRVLGSKCYHYCKEGCHHFLPLEHGSTPSKMAAVQWHSPLCEWQDIIAAVATMVHAH